MNGVIRKGSALACWLAMLSFVTALLLCAPTAFAVEGGSLAAGDLAADGSALSAQASGVKFQRADVAKGKVTWSKSTNTITMKNATIDLDKQSEKYVWYGIHVDGSSVYPTPTVTLKLVGTNTIKGGDTSLTAAIGTSSANLKVVGPGTLTVQCAGASYNFYVDGSLTAASGKVSLYGGNQGFYAKGNATLSGAKLSVKGSRGYGLHAKGNVNLNKGALTINGTEYSGIDTDGNVTLGGATVSVAKAESSAIYAWQGKITAKAGKLTVKSCKQGISCKKAFALSGKKTKVSMSGLKGSGVSSDGFTMKNGKLTIAGCTTGIYGNGGATISGGTLAVTKADSSAVSVYGGKLKITGGSVTAKCVKSSNNALYAAKGISNKPACLKTIVGRVDDGTTFKAGGNTYVVKSYSGVMLKSYGASSTAPTISEVTYGKNNYEVRGIGAKAFATKRGKAIKSITLASYLESIGANAFNGTSSLTTMNLKRSYYSSVKLNGKAFANCGKASGAKLTVHCQYSFDVDDTRQAFTDAGMSTKAKFV